MPVVNVIKIIESLQPLSVPIADLTLDPANARTHGPANIQAIKDSLTRFGQRLPIVVQKQGMIVRAGNGRVAAAKELGWTEIAAVIVDESNVDATAFALTDNRTSDLATWDDDVLRDTIAALEADDCIPIGWSDEELQALLNGVATDASREAKQDEIPDPPADPVSQRGQLWQLGDHRILCGDSTVTEDVERLMGDQFADMVHADPPYGMGKEADGVANDNLYRDRLDAFQMSWWRLFRGSATENCSLYIWGNSPALWRLWYSGGLQSEGLLLRNEIVWAKGSGFGMTSAGQHSYSPETERCLFMMRGQQFMGNQNKDDYWEGYEPLRRWLCDERDRVGWKPSDINRITATSMAGHWFGKSQFGVINRANYDALRSEAKGVAFKRTYDEVVEEFSTARAGGNAHKRELAAQMREGRTFFDNTHDSMTDVWSFGRVQGEERFGHATPKPVEMIGRAVKSSCPEGGLVAEPFLGTGTTLIAAEQLGRRCVGMEIEPRYLDVVIQRWETLTGEAAELIQ